MASAVTTSEGIWTLTKKKASLILLLFLFISAAVATTHGIYGQNYGQHIFDVDDPYLILSGFVAPFLLITLIFQRGYQKALSFTLADEPTNMWPAPNENKERLRIKKYSMIMALATAGIIVPTPWFQLIRQWVAALFGLIGFIFFGAIFAAFILVLWKAFS